MDWLQTLATIAQFLAAIGALPLLYWWIKSWRESQLARQGAEHAELQARMREQEQQSYRERRETFKQFILALDDFLLDRSEATLESLKDLYFQCVLSARDDTLRQITALLQDKLAIQEPFERDRDIDRAVAVMRRELNRYAPDEYQLAEVPVSLFMRRFTLLSKERALAPETQWVREFLDEERARALCARGCSRKDMAALMFGDEVRTDLLPRHAAVRAAAARDHRPAPQSSRAEVQAQRLAYLEWRAESVRQGRVIKPPPPPEVPDVVVPLPRATTMRALAGERIDWGLKALGIPELWLQSKGRGVTVAILDTGIDLEHPDLKDAIAGGRDFTGAGGDFADRAGHGTHCAGIVGARANGLGVIGVAPECRLLAVKVLDDRGFGSYESIISGIEWAMLQRADIISMSLGGSAPHEGLRRAIQRAVERDVIVICAAGNEGDSCGEDECVGYPAAYPETISVGSINRELLRSGFSSVGSTVDVCAPGEEVESTYPPSRYAVLSGTSMATPFVTGVAALILAKHRAQGGHTPCHDQESMRAHLIRTARDQGVVGPDWEYGYGIVNPRGALEDPDQTALLAGAQTARTANNSGAA